MQFRMASLLLALALFGAVDGAITSNPKLEISYGGAQESPPLRSDKKFFGPPFPADYVEDARPIPQKSILDKLKGPDQPYPALQSKADFDRDYVKDENSDRGAWKAQFEYDSLRRKLNKESADAQVAGDHADKEGKDIDDAQRKADDAEKNADDARKGVDDAKKEENDAMQPEDFDDMPENTLKEKKEKLEKLKTAVAAAEANYEKEKKQFELCKKEFEDAKKNLEELKAKQVEMDAKLSADTKLYMETKTVRMNLKKTKEDAAHSKHVVAIEQLKVAQAAKAEKDQILVEKKARAAKAQENFQKEKADLVKFKAKLAQATLTLQKLRGYTPAAAAPLKSNAPVTSALLSLFALVAVFVL